MLEKNRNQSKARKRQLPFDQPLSRELQYLGDFTLFNLKQTNIFGNQ